MFQHCVWPLWRSSLVLPFCYGYCVGVPYLAAYYTIRLVGLDSAIATGTAALTRLLRECTASLPHVFEFCFASEADAIHACNVECMRGTGVGQEVGL